jgi:hypothetical protein
MRAIKPSLILLLVLGINSCAIRPFSLRVQSDKRLQQLEKEKEKLKRQSDPVDYTKTQIKISELLLSLISDSVRAGELAVMEDRLDGYLSAIEAAHQMMMKSGRDAHKKPKGFKDLEIALRRQARQLEDIGDSLAFDDRQPIEKAIERAEDIRSDLMKALFGEQNAPSRKS